MTASCNVNPLSPPQDGALLTEFRRRFALPLGEDKLSDLAAVVAAFARLPYENLTKIIRWREAGSAARARRTPGQVLADHWQWGAGGTCFSLTAALLHLVRAAGWDAQPILADR